MPELVTVLAAGAVFVAAAVRLRIIRPASPTHAQRHLLLALLAVALSLVLAAPTVRAAVTSVAPVRCAIRVASNGLGMLAAYSMVVMVACVTGGPDRAAVRTRRRRLAIAAYLALVAVGVCLASSGAEFDRDPTTAAATTPELAVSQVVYWGYVGACMTRFVLLMRRYLSRPDVRPQLRCGMYVVVAAALVGMGSLLCNVVVLVAVHADRHVAGSVVAVSHLLGAAAAVLLAIGVILPVLGALLSRVAHRWRVDRALRGITPLWRQVTTMVPEVALRQVNLSELPSVALYRRVIEIRDAELILLRYVPSEIDGQVLLAFPRPRRAVRLAVRAEAIALATAMDRYRAGHSHPVTPASVHYVSVATSDLLAEARWLIRVHRAIRSDRTVARIRQCSWRKLHTHRST